MLDRIIEFLAHNPTFIPQILFAIVGVLIANCIQQQKQKQLKPKPQYKRIPISYPKRSESPKSYKKPIVEETPSIPSINHQLRTNTPPSTNPEAKPLTFPKHLASRRNPLRHKLIRLLQGDEKGADRLIAGYEAKFPGKNEEWIYEKAIHDLTRDRR